MENEKIKVYVGRRSMCAGDDMNVPNMKHFYLPDSLEKLVENLNRILPFDKWTCYLGYPIKNITGEEDGIIVVGKKDSHILIEAVDSGDTDACSKKHINMKYAENWYDLIKANPYLFCE
ncbi:hypothetical protein [Bacteroides heparinolyticus]|uniref:hypothetical protein n=1 Tax=Prevotella heparinolytica TaxID=28113 RepID=UPI0035A112B6